MNIKHLSELLERCTKGPWRTHESDELMVCTDDADIAEVGSWWGGHDTDQRTANAELIALAPQLAADVVRLSKALAMSTAEMESTREDGNTSPSRRAALGCQCDFNREALSPIEGELYT